MKFHREYSAGQIKEQMRFRPSKNTSVFIVRQHVCSCKWITSVYLWGECSTARSPQLSWPFSYDQHCEFLTKMGQIQSDEDNKEVELADIQPLYTKFMKECPSGALHLHEFRKIFGVQSTSEDEALYMETLFKSFDTNRVSVRVEKVKYFYITYLKMLKCKILISLNWVLIAKQQFVCIICDYLHVWSDGNHSCLFAGWCYRLYGICSGRPPGSQRKTGGQTEMVF